MWNKMKKFISVITVLFVMFTASNVFAGYGYEETVSGSRKETVSICDGLQKEIIKSVKAANDNVSLSSKSRSAALDRMTAAQMARFWLELFRMKSCGLLDESANIESLAEGLLGR